MVSSITGASTSAITQPNKHHRRFAKLDANGDGGLDAGELAGVAKRRGTDAASLLGALDANKDGKVDAGEMAAGKSGHAGKSGSAQGSDASQFTTALMNLFKQLQESQKGEGKGPGGKAPGDMFAKLDANGDGSLDETELGGIAKHTGQDASKVMADLDKDQDGKVSATELQAGAAKHRAEQDQKLQAVASEFTSALMNIMKQLKDSGRDESGDDPGSKEVSGQGSSSFTQTTAVETGTVAANA